VYKCEQIHTQMEYITPIEYSLPIFMFYSKSPHVQAGMGNDEHIHPDDWARFGPLNAVVDWRQMLSNFYTRPHDGPLFTLDYKRWRSVEHYFQANKFILICPQYYDEFALDSNSLLSELGGAQVRSAGRKLMLTKGQLISWNARKNSVLEKALYAKFTQNDDLATVLLLTSPAILKHRPSNRSKLVTEQLLMNLRSELSNKK
jgi:predicted NAD-dependent protein-ADP-ribosyltransferase YbiA (DUF1768 family)